MRSFVHRNRMTEAKKQALEQLSASYGLFFYDALINDAFISAQCTELILEIGFGDGEVLFSMAQTHPDRHYLGIEIYRPGIASLMSKLDAGDLHNVKIIEGDAVPILKKGIPDHCLSRIHIFFSDPWPKTRHHKRRLINEAFVQLLIKKLRSGGYLHLATDWEDYAHHMMRLLTASELHNDAGKIGGFLSHRWQRPMSKFERRGLLLGHRVYELGFIK